MDIFWSGFVEIKNFDIFFQIHFSLEIYIQQTYKIFLTQAIQAEVRHQEYFQQMYKIFLTWANAG